jgi:energy-coupling factor transport system permease protein
VNLDPRTKFLAICLLISATFLTEHLVYFTGVACLCIVLVFLTRTSLVRYLRNILLLSWLIVFTFFAPVWGNVFGEHQVIFVAPKGITFPSSSLLSGLLATAKLLVVVGWVTILGATSSALELAYGLERLLRPLRFVGLPTHTLSILVMLSIRFMPILFTEGQHLVHAYIARGIDLRSGSLTTRLKNVVLLCSPLFSSMLRRVEYLTLAMEARAFQARANRSSLYESQMRSLDYAVLAGSLLIVVLTQIVQ